MRANTPHFLLFSESRSSINRGSIGSSEVVGQWRFVLESVDGETKMEVADDESEIDVSRLELLAVVRGLEALDQPSRVTLVTPSRYVTHGLRFGLAEWRENGWQWERFGEMQRVKNWDLWQRIDRAMRFHEVDCRVWRFDMAEEGPPASHLSRRPSPSASLARHVQPADMRASRKTESLGVLAACRRIVQDMVRRCWPAPRGAVAAQAA
jgi:ribonuclease HI